MSFHSLLIPLVVGLLIGGLALFLAAQLVHDEAGEGDYSNALVTAVVGAIVWLLLAWIPLIGVILALIGWIAVVNWRYPGGWGRAAIHGIVAWVIAVVILLVLDFVGLPGLGALGVPGV